MKNLASAVAVLQSDARNPFEVARAAARHYRPTRGASRRPIWFLHIPKTGGTSIITAIAKAVGEWNCLLGDLTSASVAALAQPLANNAFVADHWGHDVWRMMPKSALKFTVLRDPRDQTVSNFLHLCRQQSEISDIARELGFRRFVTTYSYHLIFQLGSLLVPQTIDRGPLDIDAVVDSAPQALALLHQLDFVGCIEKSDDLALSLPFLLGFSEPLTLPRVNRAVDHGFSEEVISELRGVYDELSHDPVIGRLIGVERQLYEEGISFARRREEMLERARQFFASTVKPPLRLDFSVDDPAIKTVSGTKSDGLIRLESSIGCGLYGPYIDLPMGSLTALVRLVGPHRGPVRVDIAAECGEIILASRTFDLEAVQGDCLELSAVLSRPFWQCEVRLFCEEKVQADIAGVYLCSAPWGCNDRQSHRETADTVV